MAEKTTPWNPGETPQATSTAAKGTVGKETTGKETTTRAGEQPASTGKATKASKVNETNVASQGERASSPAEAAQGTSQTGTPRTATVNLPFVTAVFRAPDMHLPGRRDLDAAARRAGSFMPSRKAALYFGGLAATAVAGVIEWPVAAAIGVGTVLASRGEARPEARQQTTGDSSN